MVNKRYMTTTEASKVLGIHTDTVPTLIKQGKLKGEFFDRVWHIERATVEKLAETYIPKKTKLRESKPTIDSSQTSDSSEAAIDAWIEKSGGYKANSLLGQTLKKSDS